MVKLLSYNTNRMIISYYYNNYDVFILSNCLLYFSFFIIAQKGVLTMRKIIYYTPEEVLSLVFTGVNGKVLISKASLLNMIKRGDVPATQLGMKRRYFIPSTWVETMLATNNEK